MHSSHTNHETAHSGDPYIHTSPVDENCNGRDAPFPRVTTPVRSAFALFARFTRVTRLKVLRAPEGARIELRCKGKGCIKGVKRVKVRQAKKSLDLRRRFLRDTELRPRAVLELRIRVKASIGKVVRFAIRRTRLPKSRVLCLPPKAARPRRC